MKKTTSTTLVSTQPRLKKIAPPGLYMTLPRSLIQLNIGENGSGNMPIETPVNAMYMPMTRQPPTTTNQNETERGNLSRFKRVSKDYHEIVDLPSKDSRFKNILFLLPRNLASNIPRDSLKYRHREMAKL